MYKAETEFGTYNVTIETSTYYCGDNLAISLITEDGEPFARLSVNLPEWTLPGDKAFVDTNNCPWAEKFISDNKLGRPTGITGTSGYCTYPQYRFDMEKLK